MATRYKEQRAQYCLTRFRAALKTAKQCISEVEEFQKRHIIGSSDLAELRVLVSKVEGQCQNNSLQAARKTLDVMQAMLPKKKLQSKLSISFDVSPLPSPITEEVAEDIKELAECYHAGCFRSSIILCGRILETALHRKYYEHTNNDLLETSPGIGLGKIIAKMSDAKIALPVGLNEQIHLINNVRIMSVHKKKRIFVPSKEQTQAIVLYTLDTLKALFGKA